MPRLDDRELLRRLVAFDTTSSQSNLPLADFISEYLEDAGLVAERFLSPDRTKANLLFTAQGASGEPADGEGLTLSGHMDTVPATEPEWESDPHQLQEKDDRYLGRGTADMKGFLALAINAMADLDRRALLAPLTLLLTYDEEVGCLGAQHFVSVWPSARRLPRNTIIGEPTSLRVARMHKGHLKVRISIPGRAAHSGYPHLGINAIERAGRVIGALSELRSQLENEQYEQSHFFPTVPYVPLNIGRIEGGSAINIVPDHCTVDVGVRLMPGMVSDTMITRIRECLAERAADAHAEVEFISDSPPMLLNEEADIHRVMCGLVNQTETASVSFATDAGWLQTLGLECVLFGPGSIEVAHKANEFLPRDEFERGALLLRDTIGHYCLSASL